jgi:DNA-directed RNA polymerase specialized sigma24 family protein
MSESGMWWRIGRQQERQILTVADTSKPAKSRAEVADAIRSLSPAQWLRLKKVANLYSYFGRLMEAEDLLQEAFRRALDGARNCPVDVDIVRFLVKAMQSIANTEYKGTKRRPQSVPLLAPGEPDMCEVDPEDQTPNAEERLAADGDSNDDRKKKIIDLFADDTEAQVIVEGIMAEGVRGEDLRALTDLDPTAYQSKRRLIRRRIEKLVTELKP